jgi:hypothetical protein
MPPGTCHMVQSQAGAVGCPRTPSPCIVYRLNWQAQACIVYRSALHSSKQCTVSAVVNLQMFLNFMRITWVRIRQESILSEIVQCFRHLVSNPARRLMVTGSCVQPRGSPSCFSEQASYILKAYKAFLGLNINIKIL